MVYALFTQLTGHLGGRNVRATSHLNGVNRKYKVSALVSLNQLFNRFWTALTGLSGYRLVASAQVWTL